jgi:hypothetical protein
MCGTSGASATRRGTACPLTRDACSVWGTHICRRLWRARFSRPMLQPAHPFVALGEHAQRLLAHCTSTQPEEFDTVCVGEGSRFNSNAMHEVDPERCLPIFWGKFYCDCGTSRQREALVNVDLCTVVSQGAPGGGGGSNRGLQAPSLAHTPKRFGVGVDFAKNKIAIRSGDEFRRHRTPWQRCAISWTRPSLARDAFAILRK